MTSTSCGEGGRPPTWPEKKRDVGCILSWGGPNTTSNTGMVIEFCGLVITMVPLYVPTARPAAFGVTVSMAGVVVDETAAVNQLPPD